MMQIELGKSVELVTKGTTPTSLGENFTESGIKFLRAQNVVDGKILIDDDILFIDNETHNSKLKRSHILKGDVLLTIAGTIGRTAIVEIDEELNCNQAVAIIRLGNSEIHPNFLCHFFATSNAQSQFTMGKVTATIPNLSLSQIKKLKIPLPPLEQQKKIAAILDAADEYRQKTKALIAKYDELTQSLFLEMFGDPVTNPKGWEIKTIGDCFNVKGGKRLPKGSEYETTVTKHAYIRVKDFMANGLDTSDIKYISEEIHDKISRYIISSNDVYISIAGTIGLSGYVPESLSGANLTENAAKLIPKEAIEFRKEYLSFYLNSDYAQQNIKSKTMAVGVPKLALFRIQELPYINAPINVQDIFVRRVQTIESQKAQAQASLAQAEDLFNSLLQRAFKGELV